MPTANSNHFLNAFTFSYFQLALNGYLIVYKVQTKKVHEKR